MTTIEIMKNIISNVQERVLKTIKKYEMLTEGMSVVIGFSGGPDSLCLFDLLLRFQEKYKLNLYPVHINHNLRGNASDQDQKFCTEFAAKHGFKCDVFSFDCSAEAKANGITTEEAGRNFRYTSYIDVASRAKAEHSGMPVAIAVAQNADDQAETVLMRIIRGTGTDGLAGIPYKRLASEYGDRYQEVRQDIIVIRPLLDIYKTEILEYCDEAGLKPRFDHTNEEAIYNRNRIRLELIPTLSDLYNPNIKESLTRIAASAEEDRNYLESVARELYSLNGQLLPDKQAACDAKLVYIRRDALMEMHPAVRRRIIAMGLNETGLTEDVSAVHYSAINDILMSDNPSASTDLPKGYSVWREYGKLVMGKRSDEGASVDGEERFGKGFPSFEVRELSKAEFESMEHVSGTYCAFDLDMMEEELGEDALDLLELRNRRPGDVMRTAGGTKKIQDLLVDMKIPKNMRKWIKLLTVGNRVLWLIPAGVDTKPRYTSDWKITGNTKRIVYIVLIV